MRVAIMIVLLDDTIETLWKYGTGYRGNIS